MSISGRAASTASASAPLLASAAKSKPSAPNGCKLASESRTNGSSSTTSTLCMAALVGGVAAHQRGQHEAHPRERPGLALDLERVGRTEVERDAALDVADADAVQHLRSA